MKKLMLLFIAVPVLEIIIYIQMGKHIGIIPTLLLILGTGALGVYLARQQGFNTLVRARQEMAFGRVPGNEMLDGMLIFSGALLLLTPGLLSDITGFIFLIPFTRKIIRGYLKNFLRKSINEGKINFFFRLR